MAYANFKAHKFSFLNITNIGSDYVLKGSECGLACVNIPSCFSFNLAAFSDIMSGKILCELLPSDIFNNSKNFVASQFYHHYSITVSEKSNSMFRFVIFHRLSPVFSFKLLKQLSLISREKIKRMQLKSNFFKLRKRLDCCYPFNY